MVGSFFSSEWSPSFLLFYSRTLFVTPLTLDFILQLVLAPMKVGCALHTLAVLGSAIQLSLIKKVFSSYERTEMWNGPVPLSCPSEAPSGVHRSKEEGKKLTEPCELSLTQGSHLPSSPSLQRGSDSCSLFCDWQCYSVTTTINYISRRQQRKFSPPKKVCCIRNRRHNLYQKLDTAPDPPALHT